MIGILVATHGKMSEGMLDSLHLLAGDFEGVEALCLQASDNADDFQKKMEDCVTKLDTGDGVIIFTDIMGGTPGNRALKIAAENTKVEVVCGVNLPVLLNTVMSKDMFGNMEEAIEAVKEISEGSIVVASATLRGSDDDEDDLDLDLE